MFRFEGLEIWKLAIEYADKCYDVANTFPKGEQFALADQLRRAAVSISNNIAEGSTGSARNFQSYLERAIGSAFETASILFFATKRSYISEDIKQERYKEAENLIRKIRKFKLLL